MTHETQPRRLRADAARNRQALIDAAQRLFSARGLSVTLDDIAAEAGVNVATAYRHFSNKHELAGAFIQQEVDAAVAIAEDAAADPDPWPGLTGFLSRMLRLMADNRGLQEVFTASYGTEWYERADERIRPLVERLLSRAQGAGVVRPEIGTGDFGVLLRMLSTVSDIPGSEQELLDRYLELVFAGLRPSEVPLPGRPPSPADVKAAGPPPGPVLRRPPVD